MYIRMYSDMEVCMHVGLILDTEQHFRPCYHIVEILVLQSVGEVNGQFQPDSYNY